MSVSYFKHVRICGMKTVVPEHFIDIDDELQYFDNNPKKVARQKKMIGYGRRYVADDRTTVKGLACDVAVAHRPWRGVGLSFPEQSSIA